MSRSTRKRTWLQIVLLLSLAWALPALAGDETLDELISQVGPDYAEAYLSPLIHGFGINTNTALYHTARIPRSRLTFNFGLVAMAARINDADKSFRLVRSVNLSDLLQPGDDGYGEQGQLVFEGPTVFGDESRKGTVTAYWHGIPVFQQEAINSLVDMDYVLLATPQLSVGGVAGLRATLRWLPSVTMGDMGKLSYKGFGLSYGAGGLLPTLPFDAMVGFFFQSLDVGESLHTSADSYFAAVSKTFALLTVYAGAAKESSTMDVDYTFVGDGSQSTHIAFSVDGAQGGRGTLGATLNLGVKVNAEVAFGKMTTYSAGLLFGI